MDTMSDANPSPAVLARLRLCYLTVATIPSTTAHASFVMQLARSIRARGMELDVAKVGWSQVPADPHAGARFIGLAPRTPSATVRAAVQALLFPLLQIRKRYGMVIVHNALTAFTARLMGAPFIYDVHGQPGRGRLLRYALAGQSCKAVVFNSIGACQAYERLGLGAGKPTKIIGNGSAAFHADDAVRARVRADLGYGDDTFLVVYVGSLGVGRGMDTLRAALARLQNPKVQVLIAGGRPEDVQSEKHVADQAGLGARITYLGHVGRDRIAEIMNAADALLISYSKSVPAVDVMNPMKAHEYLATDRPILYPDLARVVDVIADDPGAFAYQSDDPNSLAQAIERSTEPLDAAALEHYRTERRITWDRVAEMYTDLAEAVA